MGNDSKHLAVVNNNLWGTTLSQLSHGKAAEVLALEINFSALSCCSQQSEYGPIKCPKYFWWTCMVLVTLWSTKPFLGTAQLTKKFYCQPSKGSPEKHLLVPQTQPGSFATENARRDPKSKIHIYPGLRQIYEET